MLVTLTETTPSPFPDSEGPMAWLENGHGPIARGAITLLSLEGAHIRMLDIGSIEPGDEVDVRLRLDRDTPSVAATGRVLWTEESNDTIECELEWTGTGPARVKLEKLIAARG